MSDTREIKKMALKVYAIPEVLVDTDVEGLLRATLDSQVRAAGYVPLAGSHEYQIWEPGFLLEEQMAAGVPADARLVTMSVRCYEGDAPST